MAERELEKKRTGKIGASLLRRLSPTGVAVAVAFYCLALTPSLLPRPWYLQGVISGILAATGYMVGVFADEGGQLVPVPDVVNQPQEFAVDILEEQGFVVGEIDEAFSDEIEEGRIVRQRPGAGTRVDEGATVDLVVSAGQQLATVPDITGLTENEARQRLREEDLIPGRADREFSADVTEGRIISSDPIAGEDVPVLLGDPRGNLR
jgi:beta-lactam-binding protein with PASTA domain